MLFMNEHEINEAVIRFRRHPVLRNATEFLSRFRDEVNNHSDGWPYWRAPVQAAAKLMTLIQNPESATPEAFRAALAPIRSFYTRRGTKAGMEFPELTDESAMKKASYCIPANAGLASEPRAVAKRLATLIETLDSFSWAICKGGILDDIKGMRDRIVAGLEADGYFCTYDGGNHMKVYEPGSQTGARKKAEAEARLQR